MQKTLGPTLCLALIAACGGAAVKDGSNANATKAPSSAQAAQVSALFASQMASSASSQGSSNSKAVQRTAATDPNCAANNPDAANDPNCVGGPGDGPGAGGTQIVTLPSMAVPCEAGGNVLQSGSMTLSETFGAGGTFSMAGNMAIEAVYQSCAMPAPDGNTYTMNAPGGVAQNMNMTMTFTGFDPNNANPSAPTFPEMTMNSTVVGNSITVYAADGSVVASGDVNLAMSITLDPNGAGYVHFSGTQFGLAVDANQTFTPPTEN